jgi:hypothetical protein
MHRTLIWWGHFDDVPEATRKKMLALKNGLNSGVTHSPVAVLAAEAIVQLNGLRRETITTRSKNAKCFERLSLLSELVFPRNLRKANNTTRKPRAPHRGMSLGPFVRGAKTRYKGQIPI